jgi:hypothetical protein
VTNRPPAHGPDTPSGSSASIVGVRPWQHTTQRVIRHLQGAPLHTHEIDTSIHSSTILGDDSDQPFLEVEGIEGSRLRATNAGLTVCHGGATGRPGDGDRSWGYEQLREVRLDAYGSVGVIRATVHATGGALPLLLLEPAQIAAARRTLEIIWNRMASTNHGRRSA